MGGDEFPQLGEGCVDVVLAPALASVGEHLSGHDAVVLMHFMSLLRFTNVGASS